MEDKNLFEEVEKHFNLKESPIQKIYAESAYKNKIDERVAGPNVSRTRSALGDLMGAPGRALSTAFGKGRQERRTAKFQADQEKYKAQLLKKQAQGKLTSKERMELINMGDESGISDKLEGAPDWLKKAAAANPELGRLYVKSGKEGLTAAEQDRYTALVNDANPEYKEERERELRGGYDDDDILAGVQDLEQEKESLTQAERDKEKAEKDKQKAEKAARMTKLIQKIPSNLANSLRGLGSLQNYVHLDDDVNIQEYLNRTKGKLPHAKQDIKDFTKKLSPVLKVYLYGGDIQFADGSKLTMKPGGQDEKYLAALNSYSRLENQIKGEAGVGALIPKYMSDGRKRVVKQKLLSDYEDYYITGIAKGEIDPPDAISDEVIAAVDKKKEELGIDDEFKIPDDKKDDLKNKLNPKDTDKEDIKDTDKEDIKDAEVEVIEPEVYQPKDVTGEKSPKRRRADDIIDITPDDKKPLPLPSDTRDKPTDDKKSLPEPTDKPIALPGPTKKRRNRADLIKIAKKYNVRTTTQNGKPRRLEYIERDINKAKNNTQKEFKLEHTVFEKKIKSISFYLLENYKG